MDTAWIQVFVLTIAECVAPAGKTVCQEQELEMLFLNENDCKVALQQLVSLKSASDNVIVDAGHSRCAPSAREREVFPNLDEVKEALGDTIGWRTPEIDDAQPDFTRHRTRNGLKLYTPVTRRLASRLAGSATSSSRPPRQDVS